MKVDEKKITERKHLSGRERRAEAVLAVLELAAEGHPGEITTGAITERMGLSPGALFRHFPTKDAVLGAVVEWVTEELLNRLDKAAEGAAEDGAVAVLQAMFEAHVGFIARHPGVPRMLFGEMQRAGETPAKRQVKNLTKQYRARLGKWLEHGQTRGEVAAEIDIEAAATLFIGIIQGLVMQTLLAGRGGLLKKQAPGLFAIYRRGIGGES
jgi:AcrR family transcriptional regulator